MPYSHRWPRRSLLAWPFWCAGMAALSSSAAMACATSAQWPASTPKRTDRKSTRLNSSHLGISYAVFCLKEETKQASPLSQLQYICLHNALLAVFTGKLFLCFFFNDTATAEIYTLSLHDALPICWSEKNRARCAAAHSGPASAAAKRSEEHTSELQSLRHLVCRLLIEKKKTKNNNKQLLNTHHSKRQTWPTNDPL